MTCGALTLWLKFIICVSLILVSGSRLCAYADIISKNSRISAGLMGVLFLACITSFPEMFTSLGSITVVHAPDLAIGDLVGAVIINVFFIAMLAILFRKGSVLAGQSRVNISTAVLTIMMLFVIIGALTLRRFTNIKSGIFNVGFGSILLGLAYIAGTVASYKREVKVVMRHTGKGIAAPLMIKFIVSALIIIISGLWLASIGKKISDFYGWNEMYVGVILIAIATTMPELAVSFAALKRNSVNMAVGNLLGSNFFNLFIIFLLDIVLRRGEFLSYVSGLNIFPAFLAIILTTIAVAAMLKKPKDKPVFPYIAWDSALIISVFLVGQYLLYNIVLSINW